ncbi:MAG TPA: TetR family transcriptional regulator [Solirubrobacterales bacterium]|jgi:AcrR family transcriptional regulator|nr:TetR family transcriptional regulator [Solirubrobacterales bacterium]
MPEEPSESEEREERPFSTEEVEDSLRRGRLAAAAATRARLERAALEVAGERGYPALTVQMLLERAGVGRARFYALFADKTECFAAAYASAADELEGELLAPCEDAAAWAEGLRGSLEALSGILRARPAWALGVLGQAQVAGGAPGARRKEALERLSRAMDRARREIGSRHSPPPTTAAFILAAIESAAVRNLTYRGGRDFAETVPELLYLSVAPYLGTEAALLAYREARRR